MGNKDTAASTALGEAEAERDLRSAMSSGLGPIFDIGDRVAVNMLSGAAFEGYVEDVNLMAVIVRSTDKKSEDRLFVLTFVGIEWAEIIEEDEDDDGGGDHVDADDDAGASLAEPSSAEPSDITPITKAKAA